METQRGGGGGEGGRAKGRRQGRGVQGWDGGGEAMATWHRALGGPRQMEARGAILS